MMFFLNLTVFLLEFTLTTCLLRPCAGLTSELQRGLAKRQYVTSWNENVLVQVIGEGAEVGDTEGEVQQSKVRFQL